MKSKLTKRLARLAGVVRNVLGAPRRTLAEQYPQHVFGRGTYCDDLRIRDWGEGAKLTIGAFSSIAAGVEIFLGGEHRTDWVTTFPFSALWSSARGIAGHPRSKGDVNIGSDVWIGSGALIGSGVTIGHGAVIGARAVITKNVAAYEIVAGNPGRRVRSRFEPIQVEKLLTISWWNWSDAVIERAMTDLLSSRVDTFIERALKGAYGNPRPQTR